MFCFELIPFQIDVIICKLQRIHDIAFLCAIEYRCCHIETKCFGCKRKMDLKHLSDIHTGRHTKWI